MADRMIVMNGGVAEQIGTPLDVYERPETLFAAQFIGSPAMNVVSAEVYGGRATLEGGAVVALPDVPEGAAMIGMRPEHLDPDPDGPLTMEIAFAEPLGANTLLHGRLAGSRAAFTASLPGVHRAAHGGDTIRLRPQPGSLHVFDPQTGMRRT